jgi:hypothetical protein
MFYIYIIIKENKIKCHNRNHYQNVTISYQNLIYSVTSQYRILIRYQVKNQK